MNTSIIINGRRFLKRLIGVHKYAISVFVLEKFEFQFIVLLLPTENIDKKPVYQLSDQILEIPINKDELGAISSWIKKEESDQMESPGLQDII